jgi:N-acetylneuraminate synthase/N,N'-diacetyllegionaminate synthase
MSGLADVEPAMRTLQGSEVVLLQCTSAYPCPPERVNLAAMATLAERFGVPVGLSDHTADIFTAIAAVAMGAVAIEKHFTLSRRLYGPDHHASLEPEQLARLVEGVRQVEAARGDGAKERDPALDPVRATFEKSVVAAADIPAGTVLEAGLLTTKRPGTGIAAARIGELVGRRAARALRRDDLLQDADLA